MQTREFKVLLTQAYDHIKEKITNGDLSYNEIYSETALAREIGISRTPVRDAIHLLYQEGLIDIIPSKGFTLHKLTVQDVMNTYEIRSAIEGFCARKLALEKDTRPAKRILLELRGSLEKQRAIYESDKDVELFVDNDQAFHSFLISYGGNTAFREIFDQNMYRIRKFATYTLAKEGRMENTLKEHQQIYDLIAAGDASGVYEAVLTHMINPLDFNLELVYQ